MVHRDEINVFLDDYLDVARIRDHSINGLQVIGKDNVSRIALGVSASLELFERAAAEGADMVIVHHGLYWTNTPREIREVMKRRLKTLFDNDMSLLAYHLPLDGHPEVGNNVQILKRLGLKQEEEHFGFIDGGYLGVIGTTATPLPLTSFVAMVAQTLTITPEFLATGPELVKKIGIISGGAASSVQEAFERGCDVYVTGEIRESSPALAKEGQINYVGLGHYNSETFGLSALGQVIEKEFDVQVSFVDIPNRY